MGEKKLPTKRQHLINLKEAVEISEGYFSNVGSIRNLICRGKLKRYGPPKEAEVDYFDLMRYLGRLENE